MNNLTPQIKMLLAAMLLAIMFTLSACGDGGSIVKDVQNDAQTAAYYVEQTVEVSSDMVHKTVVNGCGAFNPSCND